MSIRRAMAVRLALLGGAGALLAGCGVAPSLGTKFDPTSVPQLQKCVSTKAQLIKNLGQPYRKGVVSGQEQWTWYYAPGGVITMGHGHDYTKNEQNLIVAFDKAGLVADYVYNPPSGIIWKAESDCGVRASGSSSF
jgi:hypothetical protein